MESEGVNIGTFVLDPHLAEGIAESLFKNAGRKLELGAKGIEIIKAYLEEKYGITDDSSGSNSVTLPSGATIAGFGSYVLDSTDREGVVIWYIPHERVSRNTLQREANRIGAKIGTNFWVSNREMIFIELPCEGVYHPTFKVSDLEPIAELVSRLE